MTWFTAAGVEGGILDVAGRRSLQKLSNYLAIWCKSCRELKIDPSYRGGTNRKRLPIAKTGKPGRGSRFFCGVRGGEGDGNQKFSQMDPFSL